MNEMGTLKENGKPNNRNCGNPSKTIHGKIEKKGRPNSRKINGEKAQEAKE
jgi:hypothetical protein